MKYASRLLSAVLGACLITGMVGCGGAAPQPPPWSAISLRIAPLVDADSIVRLVVEVQAAGVQHDLARAADGAWVGTFRLPVGLRTLTATAYDGKGRIVGTGSASVTVEEGAIATAFIRVFDATGALPVPHHGPLIVSLTASRTSVPTTEPIHLSVEVRAPDGQALTYAWTGDCAAGSFSPPDAASTTWSSTGAGTCRLTITVGDGAASDSAVLTVQVEPRPGTLDVVVEYVPAPVIEVVTVGPCRFWRYGGSATCLTPLPTGSTLALQLTYGPRQTLPAVTVTDDCAGAQVLPATVGLASAQLEWRAPATEAVCLLAVRLEDRGLVDEFPVEFRVASDGGARTPAEGLGTRSVEDAGRWLLPVRSPRTRGTSRVPELR